jgi:hypothetical protein
MMPRWVLPPSELGMHAGTADRKKRYPQFSYKGKQSSPAMNHPFLMNKADGMKITASARRHSNSPVR